MSSPKKGVAYVTYIGLIDSADSGSFKVNPTLAVGDFTISQTGGAFANLTTLPVVEPAGSDNVKISISATEMDTDKPVVNCKDVAGAEWDDLKISIDATIANVDDIVRSTTPVNTLDISAGGEAGIDWANIGTPTSAVDLSGTDIQLVDTTTTLTDKAGFSLAATGLDAIGQAATGMIEIAKAIWDRVINKANHDIGQSAGKILRQSGDLIQIDGVVSDASPTTTDFDTNLTQVDGYFDDAIMVFSNGAANAGIGKPLSTYVNASGHVVFVAANAWPVTPINGDDFVVVALHAHPIAEIQSGLATSAEVAAVDAKIDLIYVDTQAIAPEVSAILLSTNTDGVILTAAERNAIADAMLDRDMSTGADSGSTTVRTIRQALRANRNKVTISGGIMTVYKEDDLTPSWTAVITTTAGDPISDLNPAGP